MGVTSCRVLAVAFLVSFAAAANAQTAVGMGLLAVEAAVSATPEEAAPSTADTLAAVDRILAIWPELVGTLPAGDPRYNAEDIGSIATATGAGFIVRKVMERRMISGMTAAGITIPADPTSGNPRPVDRDDNGGKARKVTRAQLEALETDTATVKSYFTSVAAKMGHQLPVNPQGLSVADWQRIKTLLRGMSLISR